MKDEASQKFEPLTLLEHLPLEYPDLDAVDIMLAVTLYRLSNLDSAKRVYISEKKLGAYCGTSPASIARHKKKLNKVTFGKNERKLVEWEPGSYKGRELTANTYTIPGLYEFVQSHSAKNHCQNDNGNGVNHNQNDNGQNIDRSQNDNGPQSNCPTQESSKRIIENLSSLDDDMDGATASQKFKTVDDMILWVRGTRWGNNAEKLPDAKIQDFFEKAKACHWIFDGRPAEHIKALLLNWHVQPKHPSTSHIHRRFPI